MYLTLQVVITGCARVLNISSPGRGEQSPRYIKITLSLSIVAATTAASQTCMSSVGNVPRGGLTRSMEHDLSSWERTGGPSRRNQCFAEHGQCNQYLYSNNLSLLCEGVLDFSWILCSLRWIYFFSPLPCPPPIAAPEGTMSGYTLSRGWVCWDSLLADLFQRIKP